MSAIKRRFIYLTENLINGKCYIGRHTGWFGDNYLGLGRDLLKDIERYGKDNFKRKILEVVDTEEELNEAEKRWINAYKAVDAINFYNLMDGGIGGNTLKNLSSEEIKRRSQKFRNTLAAYSDLEKQENSKRKSLAAIKVRARQDLEEQRIRNFKKTMCNKTRVEKSEQYASRSGSNNYGARAVKIPDGIFGCASDASKVANVSTQTVLNRCANKKFVDWSFINENN